MSSFAAKIGKALAEPVINLAETEPEMLGKIFLGLGSISAAAIGYYVNQYNENYKKVKEGMINFENVLIKSDAARDRTLFEVKEKVSDMKTEFKMDFIKIENGLKSEIMESKMKYNNEMNAIKNQLNIMALNFTRIQEEQTKFLQTLAKCTFDEKMTQSEELGDADQKQLYEKAAKIKEDAANIDSGNEISKQYRGLLLGLTDCFNSDESPKKLSAKEKLNLKNCILQKVVEMVEDEVD